MPTIRVTDETYKLVERYAKQHNTTLQEAALILVLRGYACAEMIEELKRKLDSLPQKEGEIGDTLDIDT